MTIEPGCTSTGIDSPVTADMSKAEVPTRTMPSVGTRCPVRTTITSLTVTSPVGISTSSPERRNLVVSGTRPSTARSPRRDFVIAHSSSASEIANKNANDTSTRSRSFTADMGETSSASDDDVSVSQL